MISMIPGAEATSSALNAERIRMEVVSENIANANTTRGLDGKPYKRQQVVFETMLKQQQAGLGGNASHAQGVQITRIEKDDRPASMVFNPGHPDADVNGMVKMPNINVHEEMSDMISSSRAFEANLAVMKNAKAMTMQTLSIGKR